MSSIHPSCRRRRQLRPRHREALASTPASASTPSSSRTSGSIPRTSSRTSSTRTSSAPGLGTRPRSPPLHPLPRISLDPQTSTEKSRGEVERKIVHANAVFAHSSGLPHAATFPASPAHAPPLSPTTSSTLSHAHAQEHVRHVSVSTTHTLVRPPPATRQVVHTKPAGEMPVDEEEERLDAICPTTSSASSRGGGSSRVPD